MKKKFYLTTAFAAFAMIVGMTSCSSDDDEFIPEEVSQQKDDCCAMATMDKDMMMVMRCMMLRS